MKRVRARSCEELLKSIDRFQRMNYKVSRNTKLPSSCPTRKEKTHLQSNNPQKRCCHSRTNNTYSPCSTTLCRLRPVARLCRTRTRTPAGCRLVYAHRLKQHTLDRLVVLIIVALHIARQRAIPCRHARECFDRIQRCHARRDAVAGCGGEGGEFFLDLGFLGHSAGARGGGEGGQFGLDVAGERGSVRFEL